MKVYCDDNGNLIDIRGNLIPCDEKGLPISRECHVCGTLEANTLDGLWNTEPPVCEDCVSETLFVFRHLKVDNSHQ